MRITASFVASCALTLLACACTNENDAPVESTSAPQQAEVHRPTESRLLERAAERWRLSTAGEWIDVYNLLSPKMKKQMNLYGFLEGKQNHVFEDPSAPRLVGTVGTRAYTEITITWTPQHPALKDVEIPEGESLTERFELIESWEWVDDDWYLEWPPERPNEFFEVHPELLKKSAKGEAEAGESTAKSN